ncbi:CocE/NonD family hydrolase [Streptomyces sp. NPDC050564]|uniref:CocE/NonD family hydrolase n=1 Tax=Streptomyces sp. NPDC050564 TaxID=3365631 RepID=UPI0037AF3AA1
MLSSPVEAGDIARFVREGYVHVIGDTRGTGDSGGVMVGNHNVGSVPRARSCPTSSSG